MSELKGVVYMIKRRGQEQNQYICDRTFVIITLDNLDRFL